MYRRCCNTLSAVLLATTLVGCGQSTDSQPSQAGGEKRGTTTAKGVAKETSPEQTVATFLEAVRLGDDDAAGGMLTELARRKTQEINMVVAPPGSDTASFHVGQATMVQGDVANVACSWTDLDNEGKPRTDEITWTVRRDGGAWRIAGMAAKIFPDQPPVQLNFENPEEMLRQQRRVEQEALQRASQEQRQVRNPEDPFQTGPR